MALPLKLHDMLAFLKKAFNYLIENEVVSEELYEACLAYDRMVKPPKKRIEVPKKGVGEQNGGEFSEKPSADGAPPKKRARSLQMTDEEETVRKEKETAKEVADIPKKRVRRSLQMMDKEEAERKEEQAKEVADTIAFLEALSDWGDDDDEEFLNGGASTSGKDEKQKK